MASGKEMIDLFTRLAQMLNGTGFTVFADLDSLGIRSNSEFDALVSRAGSQIRGRMMPAVEIWWKLAQSCQDSGVIFKNEEGRIGVHLDMELTPAQDALLQEVWIKAEEIKTFIENP